MITEDYVSFETAKLLKEKGFCGLCTAYYDCFTTDNFHCGNEPTDFNSINTKIRNIVAAPTLQMAVKWLREKFNVLIVIDRGENFYAWQVENNTTGKYIEEIAGECPSYEESCEAAIKYCLENLI